MQPYDVIAIIYNPVSTGPSKKNAEQLARDLRAAGVNTGISTIPTEYAGHAEKLAFDLSLASKKPLILSSSGDGGYNEVINGALRAQETGANVVVGLLPSGNANDHFSHLHDSESDTVERIVKGASLAIDVLKVTCAGYKATCRYAHSYVGLGLTPHAGQELNKRTLNFFNEKIAIIQSLFSLKPVSLKINGRLKRYDSIVFSNIDTMAKVLTLSDSASVRDGKFEVTTVRSTHKIDLLRTLAKTVLTSAPDSTSYERFSFISVRKTAMQLDGEIMTLTAGDTVTIEIEPRILRCIV